MTGSLRGACSGQLRGRCGPPRLEQDIQVAASYSQLFVFQILDSSIVKIRIRMNRPVDSAEALC